MNAAAKIYYSIYYGFRRYRHDSPHIGRRIVARKLRIPYRNIEIGVYADGPMWSEKKPKRLLLLIGQIMLILRAKP